MKILRLSVTILFAATMFACGGSKATKAETAEYPLFWTWMSFGEEKSFDSLCQAAKYNGFDGIILNAGTADDYRIAVPIARKHDLEVYAWTWTINPEHDRDTILKNHPDWMSVNRMGVSLAEHQAYVGYYLFMCPALSDVREHIKTKIRQLCEIEGLTGIAIDYHRFVDVILPTTLWPRYGLVQDQEYAEWDYGYHPAMIEKFQALHGYDPRDQEDPAQDAKWAQFRCDQITEVANEIAEVVHSYGKKMGASPFPTPEMAKQMVRQDWGKWNLDIVFPMVYSGFYTGDPEFISDCTIESAKTKNNMTALYCGMTPAPGQKFIESMDAALNNGSEGIALFTMQGIRTEDLALFKHYADSVKAQRATGKKNPAATGRTTVNTDPFTMPNIMGAVDMRIAAYVSLAKSSKDPVFKTVDKKRLDYMISNALQTNTADDYLNQLKGNTRSRRGQEVNAEFAPAIETIVKTYSPDIKLGEFKLIEKRGVTKYYEVRELNSDITFHVNFYFYGGILSGFNVEPEAKSYDYYMSSLK